MEADKKENQAVARLERRIETKLGAGVSQLEQSRDTAKENSTNTLRRDQRRNGR
jgi:hypothetical protein